MKVIRGLYGTALMNCLNKVYNNVEVRKDVNWEQEVGESYPLSSRMAVMTRKISHLLIWSATNDTRLRKLTTQERMCPHTVVMTVNYVKLTVMALSMLWRHGNIERRECTRHRRYIVNPFQAEERVRREKIVVSAPKWHSTSLLHLRLDCHWDYLKNYIATKRHLPKCVGKDYNAQRICSRPLDGETHTTLSRWVCNVYKLHRTDDTGTNVSTNVLFYVEICQPTPFGYRRNDEQKVIAQANVMITTTIEIGFYHASVGKSSLEIIRMGQDTLKLFLLKSQRCVMLADSPTSNQTCKWRQNYTCWMSHVLG